MPRFVFSSATHINQEKNSVDSIDSNDDVNAVALIALASPFPSPTTGAAVDGGGFGSVLQQTLCCPFPRGQQNFPRPRSCKNGKSIYKWHKKL